MGIISDLAGKSISLNSGIGVPRTPADRGAGRAIWQEVFGNVSTIKEEAYRQPPVRGGSYGRSALSSDASMKRLIQAMRSMAPGGWSDDRWEQTKHFVGIQYIAIHRIGEQLAQAEFQVYRRDDQHPNGKSPVQKGDPAYKLVELLQKPNRRDSFGDLLYRINQQMDLTGKALLWMVPNKLGEPMELYSIPTAIAIPQPAINPDYPDGYYRVQPIYPYGPFSSYPTPSSAVGAPIPAQWMIEFVYPHPLLQYDGYSPLTALRLHIDEVESMDRSRWYSMKRGVHPSAVLQFEGMDNPMPLPEAEIERIHADFESQQAGPENFGKLFVATPGAKLEQWGSLPVDMEYSEGWRQLTDFVMAGFGISKPAAGMAEDASYSMLFATLKQLHLVTIKPKADRIAAKLTRQLAPFFGDDLIIEIRTQRIDDHDVKNAKLNILIGAKSITKGELRKEMDLPIWGDERDLEIAGEMPMLPGAQAKPNFFQTCQRDASGHCLPAGQYSQVTPELAESQPVLGEEAVETSEAELEGIRPEPPAVFNSRPNPKKLGRFAFGPRKPKSFAGNGKK